MLYRCHALRHGFGALLLLHDRCDYVHIFPYANQFCAIRSVSYLMIISVITHASRVMLLREACLLSLVYPRSAVADL